MGDAGAGTSWGAGTMFTQTVGRDRVIPHDKNAMQRCQVDNGHYFIVPSHSIFGTNFYLIAPKFVFYLALSLVVFLNRFIVRVITNFQFSAELL